MRFNLSIPLLAGLCTICSYTQALPEAEVKRWSEDIDSYRQQLEEKHINLYHRVSREEFAAELSGLKESLPELNDQQLLVEMMRVSRLVGDGHTQFAWWEAYHDMFPFRFLNIDGEFRLVAAGADHRHLLGRKLLAIGGTPIEEIVLRLSPVVQGVENAHSLKVRLSGQINVAQILYGLGITEEIDLAEYTFEDDSGRVGKVSVQPVSMGQYYKQVAHSLLPKVTPFREKRIIESENLWLSADETRKTAYLYFRRYPSFSDMEDFAEDAKDYLDEQGTRNLIIDLRDNGGGDFFVGLGLAWGLVLVDGLDWDRGVYTLIGNRTYSAAMSNAAQYRQILNARLVGEPTGGNPVGYQDMGSFSLPNSGWTVTYSKRNYRFQDNYSEGVQPDVPIETDWESYRRGTDKPLAWVLADIASRNPEGAH